MIFESVFLEDKGEVMDGIENEIGVDGEMKEIDQEGLDVENGNEGKEDGGGVLDFEKVNEGNDDFGVGGLNVGWFDGWVEEEMFMDSILEKVRKMVVEVFNLVVVFVKFIKEKNKISQEDFIGSDDQNGKKKKVIFMNFVYFLFLVFICEGFFLFWIDI